MNRGVPGEGMLRICTQQSETFPPLSVEEIAPFRPPPWWNSSIAQPGKHLC